MTMLKKKVDEVEMQKLLERGNDEPSVSPCGASNVVVPNKALPDGTPGGTGDRGHVSGQRSCGQ
jgi:hypothetical protein